MGVRTLQWLLAGGGTFPLWLGLCRGFPHGSIMGGSRIALRNVICSLERNVPTGMAPTP